MCFFIILSSDARAPNTVADNIVPGDHDGGKVDDKHGKFDVKIELS